MSSTPHPTPRSGAAPRAGGQGAPGERRGRLASLIPVCIVVLGVLEIAILVLIGVQTSLWWSVLIVVIGWVVGVALLVAAGQQSFVRLRSLVRALRGSGDAKDHLSRPAFTVIAALLFFFPGLITDVIGLVLLVTPVQKRTVRAMGLSGGSPSARRVLYRRSGGGVVDGEIVIDARTPPQGEERTPPTIQQ